MEQTSSVHNVPPFIPSMHKSQDVEEGYSDQSLINDLLCVAVTLHTLLWLTLSALLRLSSGQEAVHVLGTPPRHHPLARGAQAAGVSDLWAQYPAVGPHPQ